MLRILTLSVLLGLVLADSEDQATAMMVVPGNARDVCRSSKGTSVAKPHRGECPGVNEVTECQQIPDGDKQKCKPCENDLDCDGSFKCCSFSGQNKCLLPIFKNPCEEDNDCPELLTCCAGTCTDTCEKY